MILIWKPRCLNAWKMPPVIGQNSELLIWWLIVEWVTTSWLGNSPYLLVCKKKSLLTSEFEQIVLIKFWEIVSAFQQNKNWCIWTSRTRDMGWPLNNICVAWQILTSLLLLPFELENGTFKSWTPHKSFRPMS